MTLLVACGGDKSQAPPPPAVDLSRQAEAASEIVDPAMLQRHTERLLAAPDPASYLTTELWRIGLAPGGAKGGWFQPFEDRRTVARTSAWVLARGDARATLGTDDVVAALGGRAGGVRLRGLQAVFVAPTLQAPAGALRSKVLVVMEPVAAPAPNPLPASPAMTVSPGQGAQPAGEPSAPSAGAPVQDLLRRAAAAGAHAVVVLPRPGVSSTSPSPSRAAELAANSGVLVVAWLDDVAARALVRIGLDLPLEALPRFEGRNDLLPLPLGTIQAEVKADVARQPHRNLVAVLPGRDGDEAVAVIATLPGSKGPKAGAGREARTEAAAGDERAAAQAGYARRVAGAVDAPVAAPPRDPRAETAAAAELLAVATAFQALSDPPRRTVVFALTDPGDDGLAGARHLLADPRLQPPRLSAGLVLAAANLGAPTQDVSFVGTRASPIYGMTARLAALQGRRVVDDPAPWRGLIWHSPAWALIQARVPVAVLEPGVVPRPGPSFADEGAVVPAEDTAPQPFSGMLEDARLAFRAALELAEGGRPARVDPVRVEAILRQSPVVVPTPIALPLARARRLAQATQSGEGAGATPPSTAGESAPGARAPGPQAPGLSSVPEFVAPPPSGTPPPAVPNESPRAPAREERPPEPAPTATPPQGQG